MFCLYHKLFELCIFLLTVKWNPVIRNTWWVLVLFYGQNNVYNKFMFLAHFIWLDKSYTQTVNWNEKNLWKYRSTLRCTHTTQIDSISNINDIYPPQTSIMYLNNVNGIHVSHLKLSNCPITRNTLIIHTDCISPK